MEATKPKKVKITLTDVVEIMQKGFEKCATKEDLEDLRKHVLKIEDKMATKEDLAKVKEELKDEITRVESVVVRKLQNDVGRLQDDMRKVKTHLTID